MTSLLLIAHVPKMHTPYSNMERVMNVLNSLLIPFAKKQTTSDLIWIQTVNTLVAFLKEVLEKVKFEKYL